MFRLLLVLILLLPSNSMGQTWPVSWEGSGSNIVHNPCGSRYTLQIQPITNTSDQAIEVEVTVNADTSVFEIILGGSETTYWKKTLAPGESVSGSVTMNALGDLEFTASLVLRVEGFADSAVQNYTIRSSAPSFRDWSAFREFSPTPVGHMDTMLIEIEASFLDMPSYFHIRSTNPAFVVVDDSILVQMPGTDTFRVAFSPSSEGLASGELIITGNCFEDSMTVSGIGLAAGVDVSPYASAIWTYYRSTGSIDANRTIEHPASVRLLDALGRVRIESTLPDGRSAISVRGLSPGWYMILTRIGATIETQKILLP